MAGEAVLGAMDSAVLGAGVGCSVAPSAGASSLLISPFM